MQKVSILDRMSGVDPTAVMLKGMAVFLKHLNCLKVKPLGQAVQRLSFPRQAAQRGEQGMQLE